MQENQKDIVKDAASPVVGGVIGAGAYATLGGVGVTVAGTAFGVTLGPFIVGGAILGVVFRGVYRLGKASYSSARHSRTGGTNKIADPS